MQKAPDGAAESLLEDMTASLYEKHYVHVPADSMRKMLEYFGSTKADLDALETIFDPTLNFIERDPGRPNLYANYTMNVFEKSLKSDEPWQTTWASRRFVPHVSYEAKNDEAGDSPEFVAANGGLDFRPVAPVPDQFLTNPALEAMQKVLLSAMKVGKIKQDVTYRSMSKADDSSNTVLAATRNTQQRRDSAKDGKEGDEKKQLVLVSGLSSVQVAPSESKLIKSEKTPSPEGIHQDGCDIGMILVIGIENVADGGTTCIYRPRIGGTLPDGTTDIDLRGLRSDMCQNADVSPHLLTPPFRMKEPLEAVLFLDEKVLHEARGALQPAREGAPAHRHVLAATLRLVYQDGSDAVMLDSAVLAGPNPARSLPNLFRDQKVWFEMDERFFYMWRKAITLPGIKDSGLKERLPLLREWRRTLYREESIANYQQLIDDTRNFVLQHSRSVKVPPRCSL